MKVSIITASYNSEETIADTMHSVERQVDIDIEHLIIDGVSTDATLALVARHERPWRNVHSAPDNGLYDAMNKGIALATGDIVGLLNSDDLYPTSDVLQAMVSIFENEPALDAVYGDLCYVKQADTNQVVRYWRSSPYQPGLFQRGWVPPHPTFFVRRQVYERLGGFDLHYRLAADWDLMARFIEVHRIRTRYLPKVLVHMRLGGETNKSWSNVWKQNREIWRSAGAHGLDPSVSRFLLGKLWSRGQQFLARAA